MNLNNLQVENDKEHLTNSLMAQKLITDNYNTFANECANPGLRTEFLKILNEEHQIQFDIFSEMQSRGWYQVKPADQTQINEASSKFTTL